MKSSDAMKQNVKTATSSGDTEHDGAYLRRKMAKICWLKLILTNDNGI